MITSHTPAYLYLMSRLDDWKSRYNIDFAADPSWTALRAFFDAPDPWPDLDARLRQMTMQECHLILAEAEKLDAFADACRVYLRQLREMVEPRGTRH